MRSAYLGLLKLCLCDLTGTSTASVGKWPDGSVRWRPLTGEDRRLRAAGMDWPLHGLTMVGLNRLDDLQACVEAVVREGIEGDLIEAGAWRGGASILMRATLDSLGAGARTVCVADSFAGFPLADDQESLNATDYLAVPLAEVEANFARFGVERGVRFVPGFFEESLPGLAGRRWSLVRLDGDTYEATWQALACLYPGLSAGGHVIIDDYHAVPECGRAVDEFRRRHGIAEPLEPVDWTCVRWRRESDAPIDVSLTPLAPGRERVRALTRTERAPVPSEREVGLEEERAELQRRLDAAEARVARLEGSPFRGPLAWLRRRLRTGRGAA